MTWRHETLAFGPDPGPFDAVPTEIQLGALFEHWRRRHEYGLPYELLIPKMSSLECALLRGAAAPSAIDVEFKGRARGEQTYRWDGAPTYPDIDFEDRRGEPSFHFSLRSTGAGKDCVDVFPQCRVLGYRVDFLIFYSPRSSANSHAVVVECDGGYHVDRNVDADRTRDRQIQRATPVLRFSSKELLKDPAKCWAEVIDVLLSRGRILQPKCAES